MTAISLGRPGSPPALRGALLCAALVALSTLAGAYYDRARYKALVYRDFTNDDAINLTAQELIVRSGFEYEQHYSVADDGYVTQLIRLINPRVARADLRPVPFIMFHGANIDSSAYLAASSIQHHPEKWPRSPDDPPATSSRRSLGFFLANNGFDVWLVGSRASNRANQGYVEPERVGRLRANYARLGTSWRPDLYRLVDKHPASYYNYSLDEVIENDIKEQVDRVLTLTGAREFSIFSYSLSTPTTMVFLAQHPAYARRCRAYFQQAPAISADHFTVFDKIYFEKLCPRLPSRGVGFTPTYAGNPLLRSLVLEAAKVPKLRYKLVHGFVNLLFGPSQKYDINLERNLLARTFQPVAFKLVQQYCHNSRSKQLTKFDYGKSGNLRQYGQPTPPVYDTSELPVQNYIVLSGTYDGLADPTTVRRLVDRTHTQRPAQIISVAGANHLTFLGGTENDRYVNEPVLRALEAACA